MARNSTTWKPGQTGNPNGRPPRGETLTDILRVKLRELKVKGKGNKPIEAKEALMITLLNIAMAGDLRAIQYIMDRVDGKPVQMSEISGPEGGPVEIEQVRNGLLELVSRYADEGDSQGVA